MSSFRIQTNYPSSPHLPAAFSFERREANGAWLGTLPDVVLYRKLCLLLAVRMKWIYDGMNSKLLLIVDFGLESP